MGQAYLQNHTELIEIFKKYTICGAENFIMSCSFANLCNNGLGYCINFGYLGCEEKNLRVKLSCNPNFFHTILAPHNKDLNHVFVFSSIKNKKPILILGQLDQYVSWGFLVTDLDITDDEVTVFDSYEYEIYLKLEFKNHDITHNYYDYIL